MEERWKCGRNGSGNNDGHYSVALLSKMVGNVREYIVRGLGVEKLWGRINSKWRKKTSKRNKEKTFPTRTKSSMYIRVLGIQNFVDKLLTRTIIIIIGFFLFFAFVFAVTASACVVYAYFVLFIRLRRNCLILIVLLYQPIRKLIINSLCDLFKLCVCGWGGLDAGFICHYYCCMYYICCLSFALVKLANYTLN